MLLPSSEGATSCTYRPHDTALIQWIAYVLWHQSWEARLSWLFPLEESLRGYSDINETKIDLGAVGLVMVVA